MSTLRFKLFTVNEIVQMRNFVKFGRFFNLFVYSLFIVYLDAVALIKGW